MQSLVNHNRDLLEENRTLYRQMKDTFVQMEADKVRHFYQSLEGNNDSALVGWLNLCLRLCSMCIGMCICWYRDAMSSNLCSCFIARDSQQISKEIREGKKEANNRWETVCTEQLVLITYSFCCD